MQDRIPSFEGMKAWMQAGRRRQPEDLARAWSVAGRALKSAEAPAEVELLKRGFRIRLQALSIPGALVRARVLLLDPEGMADLSGRLARRGLPGPARERILAHELFHVLEPACPEPLAELAAHLFAGALLNLRDFPGAIDLPDAVWEARPAETR
jgi:hypothetical protein